MFDRLGVLWGLMRGQRLRYLIALATLALGVAVGYLVPLVARTMLDGVILGKPVELPSFAVRMLESAGGMDVFARNLWAGAAALVALTGLSGLFFYLKGRWSAVAAEAIARRLRDRLYDQLHHLPTTYHDKGNIGDLVQRCTSDVETVRGFLATQVIEVGRAVLMLAAGIPLMLYLDTGMTLVSLAVVPVVVTFSVVFFLRVRAAFKLSDEAEGEMTALLQENLTGIRVVRAFARQEFEVGKFARKNALYRDRTKRLIDLLAWYWSASDFMCAIENGLVLLVGAYWVARGHLTVGTLYAFIAYVNMFLWPVRQMGRILTDLGKTQVSLGRLHEILDHPREPDPPGAAAAAETLVAACPPKAVPSQAGQTPPVRVRGELRFEKLSFAHGTGEKAATILHDFTLHVPAGQTLALLGPAGSGKSTLVHLLLRLYDYTSGSIRLDGVELKDLPRKFVRAQMAAVLQEPFLYSRSLRENIQFGRAGAQQPEVQAAAVDACIHDAIQAFEKGYDTVLGERGVTLSGGQRQRVALARALLRDPAILILDDALSAVDTRTESVILDALKARRGKRVTIVIAHRLSTLQQADRIVVLEKGRIAQLGTHEELVARDGMYRRLWQIQTALEEDLKTELLETGSERPGMAAKK